jgi:hypothetical protein
MQEIFHRLSAVAPALSGQCKPLETSAASSFKAQFMGTLGRLRPWSFVR